MTKNKLKLIAGKTYDEWLEPTKKKSVPIKDQKQYSNQLIAFLDVLGIKSLIDKHRDGDEHIAIDTIENIWKIVDASTSIMQKSCRIECLHISDSVVFVCEPDAIVRLIELLSTIQMRIITECKFLLRGAITIGDAIVREEARFIVGPAYIQAFQLQEDDAIYPRIIVDKSGLREIEKREHLVSDYLQQDLDKEFFVDYIKVYMKKQSLGKQRIRFILRSENIFKYLRDSFTKNYQDDKHNISQKYGWTIQYFKESGVLENGQ